MNVVQRLIDADKSRKAKILLIGDAMTDIYVHGRLDIGQENCPKFVESSRHECPGGVANANECLKNWNASVVMVNGRSSTKKTRYVSQGRVVFRHDEDANHDAGDIRQEWIDWMYRFRADAVLLSDYDKGFLTPDFIRAVIDICTARGIPCVADAKREPSLYAGAILKCNIDYAKRFNVNPNDTPSYVITHGDKTPAIWDKGVMINRHPQLPAVQCINHVGAGDCFAAHMTLALAHGFSLEEAATIGNHAGRVYVQHPHNRPPWPHEIKRDCDPVLGKIVVRDELAALRQSENRVVFTNGVFRVPHAGHAWLLRWAKERGGTLVVGVNDDASAARLRPGEFVMPLSERMEIIASMACVDYVVPFSEDDPRQIIEALKPDLMVKGHEYDGVKIPCMDMVKTMFAPASPYPDRSASSTVAEICGAANWHLES